MKCKNCGAPLQPASGGGPPIATNHNIQSCPKCHSPLDELDSAGGSPLRTLLTRLLIVAGVFLALYLVSNLTSG